MFHLSMRRSLLKNRLCGEAAFASSIGSNSACCSQGGPRPPAPWQLGAGGKCGVIQAKAGRADNAPLNVLEQRE